MCPAVGRYTREKAEKNIEMSFGSTTNRSAHIPNYVNSLFLSASLGLSHFLAFLCDVELFFVLLLRTVTVLCYFHFGVETTTTATTTMAYIASEQEILSSAR